MHNVMDVYAAVPLFRRQPPVQHVPDGVGLGSDSVLVEDFQMVIELGGGTN